MPHFCHAFGLPVATELAIPGAVPAEKDLSGQTVFTVVLGAVALDESETGAAERRDGPYRATAEGLLFEKQGVARYLCCRSGEQLIVDRAPGAPEDEIAAYLIATAIPGLLWMRGDVVLHGAVAVLPGAEGAVGLLGVSGSGKSRLLQEIVEAGGSVAAEDSLRVWCEEGRLIAAGLPGLIHGRAAGAVLGAEREIYEVPAEQWKTSAELSTLVVLELEQIEVTEPVRLDGVAAFEAVLRNRHRPRIPDLLGLSAGVLPRCGALARELPVYSWEFLQAASRSPGKGGTWRMLAGLQHREDQT